MKRVKELIMPRLKPVRKYLYRGAGIVCAFVVFIGITQILNYMYVKANVYNDIGMARVLWHNFYENKGKIDNVYIGSSHVYTAINAELLDELNGQYNFNLASSSQRLNGSYYLLKEADRNNSLSNVYLELYYRCSVKDSFNSDVDPINTYYHTNWKNTDYMEISLNRLEYMLSIAGPEKYTDIFLPFVRYRSNLDEWDYIKNRIKEKNEDSYINYEHYVVNSEGKRTAEYSEQGYFSSTGILTDRQRRFEQDRVLKENPMGEISGKYLIKIIEYCQDKDIPLILFASPVDELELIGIEGYDSYINQVRQIAKSHDVVFYDFNLVKEEYLPVRQGEYFYDTSHLNSAGAEIFTEFFAKVMSGDASDNEKYFYESYAEKLQSEAPCIYGIYYRKLDDEVDSEAAMRRCWVASNKDEGMEYRIIMSPEGGGQYIVQDFSENKEFTVPVDEHGVCTIVARTAGNPDDVQTLEVDY